MTDRYLALGGGYSYAVLRCGLVLRNPAGCEVYIQPGDDESAMRENIDALNEVSADKINIIADMVFGDYFS